MLSRIVTPDVDRLEALAGWLNAHVQMATHPDQCVTLEGRAAGLLEIVGALREFVGDVKWFPVSEIVMAPPGAMVKLQVRAGDLMEMASALRGVLATARRQGGRVR